MRRVLIVLAFVSSIALQIVGPASNAAAAPAVALNPSSGNPPSVSGSLSGSGWLCSSGGAPAGGATVSGSGVGGSATINRDGSLSGSFTVRGTAGQRVEVKVTASTACPGIVPIYLQATAVFTFNAPAPTPTPTAAIPPTPPPTPTATPQPPATATFTATPPPPTTPTPTATVEPTPTATAPSAPTPSPTVARGTEATPTLTAAVESAPTSMPSATETPTPSVGETPPVGLAGGQGSLVFVGCTPAPSQVKVDFLPLGVFAAGGTVVGKPSGPAVSVPAVQLPGDPQQFTFQSPPGAEMGRIYQVSVNVDDAGCPLNPKSTKRLWLADAGRDFGMPLVTIAKTTLQVGNNGDQPPKPLPQVKGAFVEFGKPAQYGEVYPAAEDDSGWGTALGLYGGELKNRKQRFRWSTEATTAVSGTVQVAWLPLPKGYEDDPFAPPGLLLSWPVDCVNCEFVVDLSGLPAPGSDKPAAAAPTKGDSWLEKLGQIIVAPFKAVGDAFAAVAKAVAGLFGGSKETAAQPGQQSVAAVTPIAGSAASNAPKPGSYKVGKNIEPPVFSTFYFRILPAKDGKVAGAGSNTVVISWLGEENPLANIDLTAPPTPTPVPQPYEVEIVSYNPITPPIGGCAGRLGYVVTEDTWLAPGLVGYTTDPKKGVKLAYKKDTVLCPPTEDEGKAWYEYVGEALSDTWNWLSEAYKSVKGAVISAVGYFIPDYLCDDSCVGGILDAALVSMGIPPDIPNLDQLMNEGLDYLAEQAMAEIGIPDEVKNLTGAYAGMALAEAEAKFKAEAQAKIKDGLKEGAKQIALSYAKSDTWLPKGVPVRPDDYLPANVTVKVTRKPGEPGGDDGCTLTVSSYLKYDQSKLDNPPPGYEKFLKERNSFTEYDLYQSLKVPVPALAPGQSVTIPIAFTTWNPKYIRRPYPNSQWNVLNQKFDEGAVWPDLQQFGNVYLYAGGAIYLYTNTVAGWNKQYYGSGTCGKAQLEDIPAGVKYVAP